MIANSLYEKGINQKSLEITKKMLDKNMDINISVKITGLTKEKIEDLK